MGRNVCVGVGRGFGASQLELFFGKELTSVFCNSFSSQSPSSKHHGCLGRGLAVGEGICLPKRTPCG